MNSTDLVAKVHEASYIDDSHPEYTSARIMGILWDQQNVNFSPLLVKSRQGFGLRWSVVPTVAGVPFVRIPSRAIVNSLERVDLSTDGVNYYKLREATPREWPSYEAASGVPSAYMKRGDKLFLGAVPSSVLSVRLWYYLRPSQIYEAQTIGEVTAKTTASVTVAAKPLKYPSVGGVGVAVAAGDLCDIVTARSLTRPISLKSSRRRRSSCELRSKRIGQRSPWTSTELLQSLRRSLCCSAWASARRLARSRRKSAAI